MDKIKAYMEQSFGDRSRAICHGVGQPWQLDAGTAGSSAGIFVQEQNRHIKPWMKSMIAEDAARFSTRSRDDKE